MFGLPSNAVRWLGVGALLTALGYLIRFRGWTFLLAGHDRTAPVPDDVVGNIAVNTVLRIGLASVALGVLVVVTDTPPYLPTLFDAVVLLAVGRLLYRLHTYTPADAAET